MNLNPAQGPFPVIMLFPRFPCHIFSLGRGGLGLSPQYIRQNQGLVAILNITLYGTTKPPVIQSKKQMHLASRDLSLL